MNNLGVVSKLMDFVVENMLVQRTAEKTRVRDQDEPLRSELVFTKCTNDI